ncbi:transcription factor, STE-like protein, partial [Blyttiomyces helicus]
LETVDRLKTFLATAPSNWNPLERLRRFTLPCGEFVSCVFWGNMFHITGTDILRVLVYKFHVIGRPVRDLKKLANDLFSDLRQLKAGVDATMEEPTSEFLKMLYEENCIRSQKKQKVFYWYSVRHDKL